MIGHTEIVHGRFDFCRGWGQDNCRPVIGQAEIFHGRFYFWWGCGQGNIRPVIGQAEIVHVRFDFWRGCGQGNSRPVIGQAEIVHGRFDFWRGCGQGNSRPMIVEVDRVCHRFDFRWGRGSGDGGPLLKSCKGIGPGHNGGARGGNERDLSHLRLCDFTDLAIGEGFVELRPGCGGRWDELLAFFDARPCIDRFPHAGGPACEGRFGGHHRRFGVLRAGAGLRLHRGLLVPAIHSGLLLKGMDLGLYVPMAVRDAHAAVLLAQLGVVTGVCLVAEVCLVIVVTLVTGVCLATGVSLVTLITGVSLVTLITGVSLVTLITGVSLVTLITGVCLVTLVTGVCLVTGVNLVTEVRLVTGVSLAAVVALVTLIIRAENIQELLQVLTRGKPPQGEGDLGAVPVVLNPDQSLNLHLPAYGLQVGFGARKRYRPLCS